MEEERKGVSMMAIAVKGLSAISALTLSAPSQHYYSNITALSQHYQH